MDTRQEEDKGEELGVFAALVAAATSLPATGIAFFALIWVLDIPFWQDLLVGLIFIPLWRFGPLFILGLLGMRRTDSSGQ